MYQYVKHQCVIPLGIPFSAVSSSVNMTGGGYYVDAKSCVEDICNVTIYWKVAINCNCVN